MLKPVRSRRAGSRLHCLRSPEIYRAGEELLDEQRHLARAPQAARYDLSGPGLPGYGAWCELVDARFSDRELGAARGLFDVECNERCWLGWVCGPLTCGEGMPAEGKPVHRLDGVDAELEYGPKVGLLCSPETGVDLSRNDPPGQPRGCGERAVDLSAEPGPELFRIADRVPDSRMWCAEHVDGLDLIGVVERDQPPGCLSRSYGFGPSARLVRLTGARRRSRSGRSLSLNLRDLDPR